MKKPKPKHTEKWQVNHNTWIELPKGYPAKDRKAKIKRLLEHIRTPLKW